MDRARRASPTPFPEGARQSQRPGKHSPAAGPARPDRPGNGFPVCASRSPGTESREPGSPGIGHPETPTCSETPGLRSSGTGSPQKTFTCCSTHHRRSSLFRNLPHYSGPVAPPPSPGSPTAPQFIAPLSPSNSAAPLRSERIPTTPRFRSSNLASLSEPPPSFVASSRARCAPPSPGRSTAPQFIVPLSPSSSAPASIDRINSNGPRVCPFGAASPPGESSQQSPYRRSVRKPFLPPPSPPHRRRA